MPVLKFLNLIDGNGAPTERWAEYRSKKYEAHLASWIKESYKQLYAQYPDAHARPVEEVRDFFQAHTSLGAAAINHVAATFQTVCKVAKFSDDGDSAAIEQVEMPENNKKKKPQKSTESRLFASSPEVTISLQIVISPESSEGQIEQIFKQISKYIYKNE